VAAFALLIKGGGSGPTRAWSSRQYLELNLDGALPEQPRGPRHAAGTHLRARCAAWSRAWTGRRRRVRQGVVVRPGSMSNAGWGKLQELRDALLRYRRSGKPAYAHLETAGNQEYYLATACDRIYAVPGAILDVTGLASEITFFAGTLDKLGVVAQFEVWAVQERSEPVHRARLHRAAPRAMEALLDSLFEQYLAAIVQGRKKTREQARELIDGGPYDAARALAAGLVDELLYADELPETCRRPEPRHASALSERGPRLASTRAPRSGWCTCSGRSPAAPARRRPGRRSGRLCHAGLPRSGARARTARCAR